MSTLSVYANHNRVQSEWAKEVLLDAIDKYLVEAKETIYVDINHPQFDELVRQRNRISKFLNLPPTTVYSIGKKEGLRSLK